MYPTLGEMNECDKLQLVLYILSPVCYDERYERQTPPSLFVFTSGASIDAVCVRNNI